MHLSITRGPGANSLVDTAAKPNGPNGQANIVPMGYIVRDINLLNRRIISAAVHAGIEQNPSRMALPAGENHRLHI